MIYSMFAMKEEEVATALAKFLKLDTYTKTIVDNCIDGSIFQCTEEEIDDLLKESGIRIPGHRMRIRKWVLECKRKGSVIEAFEYNSELPPPVGSGPLHSRSTTLRSGNVHEKSGMSKHSSLQTSVEFGSPTPIGSGPVHSRSNTLRSGNVHEKFEMDKQTSVEVVSTSVIHKQPKRFPTYDEIFKQRKNGRKVLSQWPHASLAHNENMRSIRSWFSEEASKRFMETDFKQNNDVRNECYEYVRTRMGELRPLVFVDDEAGTMSQMRWKLEDIFDAILNRKHEYTKAEKKKVIKLEGGDEGTKAKSEEPCKGVQLHIDIQQEDDVELLKLNERPEFEMILYAVPVQATTTAISRRQKGGKCIKDDALVFGKGKLVAIAKRNPFKLYKIRITYLEPDLVSMDKLGAFYIPCGQHSKFLDTRLSKLETGDLIEIAMVYTSLRPSPPVNVVESQQPIVSEKGELTQSQSTKLFSGDTILVGEDEDEREESNPHADFYMGSQRRSSLGSNGTPDSNQSSDKAISGSGDSTPKNNSSNHSSPATKTLETQNMGNDVEREAHVKEKGFLDITNTTSLTKSRKTRRPLSPTSPFQKETIDNNNTSKRLKTSSLTTYDTEAFYTDTLKKNRRNRSVADIMKETEVFGLDCLIGREEDIQNLDGKILSCWGRLTYLAQINVCILLMDVKNRSEVESQITDWIASKNAKCNPGKKIFVGHQRFGIVEKVEMVSSWALDAGVLEVVNPPPLVKGRQELSMDNISFGDIDF